MHLHTHLSRLTQFALIRTPEEAASLLAGGCGCSNPAPSTSTLQVEDAPSPSAPVAWEGVIGIEGELTGDGRFIESNALYWDDLPIPLRHAAEDHGQHDGAVVVGRILTIERRKDGKLWATGDLDSGSDVGREAARQVGEGLTRGVSMDLDNVSFEVRVAKEVIDDFEAAIEDGEGELETDEDGRVIVFKGSPDDEIMAMTSARVRAATIVSIPAFAGANIDLIEGESAALTGEVVTLALTAREAEDIPEGATCAVEDCPNDPTMEVVDEADPDAGRVLYCPTHAEEVVEESREEDDSRVDDDFAAPTLVAAAFPVAPPARWFDNPNLTEPTPLRITEDGHIYGHLAVWGTCHTAYSGQCVEPPHSPSNYAYFLRGSVLTADGSEVATGAITLDTLHADGAESAAGTMAHYEHTGRGAADVTAGEDAYGIWVSGAVRPGLSEKHLRALRASPLSGDWRRISGSLELVAALSVNVPGFPVPRPQGLVASGAMQSLVASGMLAPRKVLAPGTPGALTEEDLRYLKRLAAREKKESMQEAKSRADELAARLRSTRAAALAARIQ